jgi:hypothetical protein
MEAESLREDVQIPFATPKLSSEIERRFILIAIQEAASKTVHQISPENYLKFQHGREWNFIVYENGKPVEQIGQMSPVRSTIAIGIDRIMAQDPKVIPDFIHGISDSMAAQMSSVLYQKMHEAAVSSGAMFEFSPSGITLQQYLDVLRKCDCTVDELGKISWPELFNIPPHLREKLDRDLADAPSEFKEQLESVRKEQENKALLREEARLNRYEKFT